MVKKSRRNSKKYWFIIGIRYLYYFKTEKVVISQQILVQIILNLLSKQDAIESGKILLESASVRVKFPKLNFSLEIILPTGKVYHLTASTTEDRDEWVETINKVIVINFFPHNKIKIRINFIT